MLFIKTKQINHSRAIYTYCTWDGSILGYYEVWTVRMLPTFRRFVVI